MNTSRAAHLPTRLIAQASFAVLSALAATALAAKEGSTDIYANDFAASFGASGKAGSPSVGRGGDASTDTWAINGFRVSFGSADSDLRPAGPCSTGSTDIWGPNGFAASFGQASSASRELAQACQSIQR